MDAGFTGRVAVVTGAGSGIGRAVAQDLAAQGAKLLLFDRDGAALEATAAQCPGAHPVTGDVTRAEDLACAAAEGLARLGPASFLVTAAGMLGPAVPAIEAAEEDWDRLFAVNVKGTWLTARAFIPQIRLAGGGAVVTIASTAGLTGSVALPAYSASKGAVVMLSRSLALAHAPEGIRVNCVCPGSIETPMLAATFDAAGDAAARAQREAIFRARHPLGRFGTAAEVSGAVLYLLGEQSGFVTGISMPVDGGRLA